MNEDQVRALFLLAGIKVLEIYEIKNQYWPDNEHYDEVSRKSPWFLVKTPVGLVRIGRRKNVFSVDYADTPIRKIITEDNVTKDEKLFHAWTDEKLLEYLKALAVEINQVLPPVERITKDDIRLLNLIFEVLPRDFQVKLDKLIRKIER